MPVQLVPASVVLITPNVPAAYPVEELGKTILKKYGKNGKLILFQFSPPSVVL